MTGNRNAPATYAQCLMRGMKKCCPRCGLGNLFDRYIALKPACSRCGLVFDAIRADDAPAYFTIFIVGHIVVSLYLALEKAMHPEPWIQAAIWMPVTAILSAERW